MSASSQPPNDGNHAVGIMQEAGFVIARFQHPIEWLKMEPQNAVEIAGGLMRAAFEARNGRPPRRGIVEGMQDEMNFKLTEQKREVLINRMVLMLTQINSKPIPWQAAQIVDTCMAELA